VPFGFRRGESCELVSHEAEQEAIREMIALQVTQGGDRQRSGAARRLMFPVRRRDKSH